MALPSLTRNFKLNKPAFSASPWHDEVNDNFDRIDALLGAAGIKTITGVWTNSTIYERGQRLFDLDDGSLWGVVSDHTSPATGNFADDREDRPNLWSKLDTSLVFRGAWATATDYMAGDFVYDNDAAVVAYALVSHTSGVSITADEDNWAFFIDIEPLVASAKDRANHTGTQSVTTITGLGDAATAPSSALGLSILAGATATVDRALLEMPKQIGDFAGATDTARAQAAAASGRTVWFPKGTYVFDLQGINIDFASDTYFVFEGGCVLDMNVDGHSKGLHFPTGISDAGIFFNGATITCANTLNNADGFGGYAGMITIGDFYYDAIPTTPVKNITIQGPAYITCDGVSLNNHVVDVYGFSRRCFIGGGLFVRGWSNFVYSQHWGYTTTSGNEGELENRQYTFHPDLIFWNGCTGYKDPSVVGATARIFSAAAGRRIFWEDCHAIRPHTLGWNAFCGDFGGQYAYDQTLDPDSGPLMQYHWGPGCDFIGTVNAVTVDGQTSGLHGSNIWTATDEEGTITGSIRVTIEAATTSAAAFAVSLVKNVDMTVYGGELGSSNTEYLLTLFGVENAVFRGSVVTKRGVLVRGCKNAQILCDLKPFEEELAVAYTGVVASCVASDGIVAANAAIGATSINLSSMVSAIVTGAGGVLKIGSQAYKIRKSTYATTGAQTIYIDPLRVAVLAGATVTVEQTCRTLYIGQNTISGYNKAIRVLGSGTALFGRLIVDRVVIDHGGTYDIESTGVRFTDIKECMFTNGGKNASARGITIAATNIFTRIRDCIFDTDGNWANCVYFSSGADGVVDGCYFGAATTGAIFRADSAPQVGNQNRFAAGVTPVQQSGAPTLTIASDTVTVPYAGMWILDTEASAASDDLATINGGINGMQIALKTASSSRDVTIKDGTGNIQCGGDRVLDNNTDTILLQYYAPTWYEVGFANNT